MQWEIESRTIYDFGVMEGDTRRTIAAHPPMGELAVRSLLKEFDPGIEHQHSDIFDLPVDRFKVDDAMTVPFLAALTRASGDVLLDTRAVYPRM